VRALCGAVMRQRRIPPVKHRRTSGRAATTGRPSPPPRQARSSSSSTRGISHERSPISVARTIDAAEPQGLTATFCLDSGQSPGPYPPVVRFFGRRLGVTGRPQITDTFTREERIPTVVPGSGPISITARFFDMDAGRWSVSAEVAPQNTEGVNRHSRGAVQSPGGRLQPVAWCWHRWGLEPRPARPLETKWTRLTAFDSTPAVVPGSWVGLVTLGIVIGFVVQALLVAHHQLVIAPLLPVSLVALLSGLLGAKLWYIALNPTSWRHAPQEGWCIQGALVGATASGAIAVTLLHLPLGALLDVTSPGLFFGMAVGRLGCFLTGCCAGRPTASRFGVWSSDRQIGARRIPTQLMESMTALVIGLVATFVLLHERFGVPGLLFVAAMAAYTLCRQVILPMRAEPRRSAIGSRVTAGLSALALGASVLWMIAAAS
jgi:phosphatidylglycerol:prolipoprotein diacylglycerol transferase